ncbi:aromatic ring-hydroxylating dioxygenase subunit alpha [Rhodobacteraceae bacterium NNCM2]|nr:aromatic ring-hydroxylating dioxygenase subunit alpha [Coraliihabitans acroporae]
MTDSAGKPNGQRIPNGMLQDNAPRNMWWVAAHSSEVTEKPLARWLLERPVVLYRLPDATPAALDDRCPHRWAPLSEGHVSGDQIVCPYHGMEFGADGACTKVPTQKMMPKNAAVRSYPVRESGAFIWIWMGDPEAIDADPVDMSYTADPGWSVVHGYYEVDANWVMIRENVLDLTHIAFLHANTFKQNDWVNPPEAFMDGETVVYRQEFDAAPLSPLFCAGMGLPEDKPVTRVQEGRMPSLAVSFSDWNVHDPNPEEGRRSDFLMRGCHIVTPSIGGKTHYFWAAAFDVPEIPAEVAEKTKASIIAAFDEDKGLLEKMQAQISADPRQLDYPEITLGADSAGVKVRQVLNRKLAAENRAL